MTVGVALVLLASAVLLIGVLMFVTWYSARSDVARREQLRVQQIKADAAAEQAAIVRNAVETIVQTARSSQPTIDVRSQTRRS